MSRPRIDAIGRGVHVCVSNMKFSVLTAACGVAMLCVALTVTAQQIPSPTQAQQALQQNPAMADSLRQRLLQSGLTPDQIRARLREAGYPDSMLDAYLGPTLPGQVAPMPGEGQLGAIQALGLAPFGSAGQLLPMDTGLIYRQAYELRIRWKARHGVGG